MIKNDRQYRITKAAAARFQEALALTERSDEDESIAPAIRRAQRDAIESQLSDLQAELRDYEEVANGKRVLLEVDSLAELPRALIRARIASGLSHKELAKRLHIKEQQIQRYEATDYMHASLARLLEIAEALDINVRKEIFLPLPKGSVDKVLSRLQSIGIPKDFLFRRLLPSRPGVIPFAADGDEQKLFAALARTVAHVFGWTPSAILGEERPWLESGVLGSARFKSTVAAEERFLEAYTYYAHYLALSVLTATAELARSEIPTDPAVVRQQILERDSDVSFRSALQYTWDLGVPVLPLNDPGAFQAACWRVDGRNVIVLKQRTQSQSRWLFDLLHELHHAGEEPHSQSHEVIESRLDPKSPSEQRASSFAGEVMLGERADELARLCAERAGGSIERLKSVVPRVAEEHKVDTGALANYIAFRLGLQGQNWWGVANNLQPRDEDPWMVARDALLARLDWSRLESLDQDLLAQAITDSGE